MHLNRWGWKLKRRHCCWDMKINLQEGHKKLGNNEREKHENKQQQIFPTSMIVIYEKASVHCTVNSSLFANNLQIVCE